MFQSEMKYEITKTRTGILRGSDVIHQPQITGEPSSAGNRTRVILSCYVTLAGNEFGS